MFEDYYTLAGSDVLQLLFVPDCRSNTDLSMGQHPGTSSKFYSDYGHSILVCNGLFFYLFDSSTVEPGYLSNQQKNAHCTYYNNAILLLIYPDNFRSTDNEQRRMCRNFCFDVFYRSTDS